MTPHINMLRVIAAVHRYGNRTSKGKTHAVYPLSPSPVAGDAAIRKPLKSHGKPCKAGFGHPHFLNRD
jgi:hypothetical protein